MNRTLPISSIAPRATAKDDLRGATGTGEAELRGTLQGKDKASQAEIAAKQMEGYFFNLLLTEMRKSAPEGGLIGKGGLGGKIYSSMLDQEYARLASGEFKLDFHDALVRQILDPVARGKASGRSTASPPYADSASVNPTENSPIITSEGRRPRA